MELLREEYVKLQSKLAQVEKKYQVATAGQHGGDEDSFVGKLLRTVAELFDKPLYRYIHSVYYLFVLGVLYTYFIL